MGTGVSVEVVSEFRFFSAAASEDTATEVTPLGIDLRLTSLRDAVVPSAADIVILQSHARKTEPAYLEALRRSGYRGAVAGWFWDNHHAKEANRRVAAHVDVAIAAHDCHAGYLKEHAVLLPSVMLSVAQWTAQEARAGWSNLQLSVERRPDLYGGFGHYRGTERTACLEALIATGHYPALRFTDDPARRDYFKQTAVQRLHEWAEYAVSLCLPYRNDLSNRFFDAWLAGQIPIVTPDIPELDAPWALEHLDRHFVRAAGYDRASLDAAHQRALAIFREGGIEGQAERHALVLQQHMLHHRIARIVGLMRQAAHG